ncbi:hypothetical protein B4119_2141 [Parageobacillus caldoxylosilyticus]|uniref:Uncharacterized protein n=1 Tax=Saccharococcus caldoxylosilyticus TaxID=81408 RepID=A0A150LU18_9BACL|nr:hypothetical protein B4119_2141 [Parageobacillus caldoxylosilyticus]
MFKHHSIIFYIFNKILTNFTIYDKYKNVFITIFYKKRKLSRYRQEDR